MKHQNVKPEKQNLIQYAITQSYLLLDRKKRKKYLVLLVLQFMVNILELLGIYLLAYVALNINSLISGQTPKYLAKNVYEFLQIKSADTKSVIIIFLLTAILFFSAKTILSLYINKKTLNFLANESTEFTKKGVRKFLESKSIIENEVRSQEIINSLIEGSNSVTIGILGSTSFLLSDVVMLFIMMTTLVIFSFNLGFLGILIMLTLIYVMNKYAGTKAYEFGIQKNQADIVTAENLYMILTNFKDIYTRQKNEFFTDLLAKERSQSASRLSDLTFLAYFNKYVMEVALILAIGSVGIFQAIKGDSLQSLTTIGFFLVAGTRILPAVLKAQQSYLNIKQSAGQVAKYLGIANLEQRKYLEINESSVRNELNQSSQLLNKLAIECKSVTYSYDKKEEKYLLKDLNMKIEKNTLSVITGASGSGKTTLLELIVGLKQPSDGEIRLFGVNPNIYIEGKMGRISYINQNFITMRGSLAENIAFGFFEKNFDLERMTDCLNEVDLMRRFKSTIDFNNIFIEEMGEKLSGGEKNRLAIARALYYEPDILIIDEGTNALDEKSEMQIIEMLKSKLNNMTILSVSHRSNFLEMSDLVIRLDNGISGEQE